MNGGLLNREGFILQWREEGSEYGGQMLKLT